MNGWFLWAPLALAPPPADGQAPGLFMTLMPFILIFAIFYFLLIAPARKKQKRHTEMLGQLKNGDKVITTGGMYGTVVGVSNGIVQLRIADTVKIEVAKSAVAGRQEEGE